MSTVCTPSCQAYYGKDFSYLQGLPVIPSNNGTLKKLQSKTNLSCVRNFLASIAHKVR